MTEETPAPEQNQPDVAATEPEPIQQPTTAWEPMAPQQDPWEHTSEEATTHEVPAESGAPAEPAAEPAPADPAPIEPAPAAQPETRIWEPEQPSFPSPEEDAALREHRAQRYGAPEASTTEPPVTDAAGAAEASVAAVTPVPAPSVRTYQQHFEPVTTPLPAAPTTPMQQQQHYEPTYEELHEISSDPVSRAAAHWWTILITLVFAPVAWYLFTDGGARIEWAASQSTPIAIASYIEFVLGLLAVFIFMLAARWSSVGSIIMGSIAFILGVAYLLFPFTGAEILTGATDYFSRLGQFGLNVQMHLSSTLVSGRMALFGLALIMVGVVSHGARRQGRREERTKIALGG